MQRAATTTKLSVSSPVQANVRRSANSTPKPRLRHDDSQIQFAPIDSSPLPTEDESQHLTEHQKEVKTRQQDNAQLFHDLSSSPTAQSTALQKRVAKRLDFSTNMAPYSVLEGPATPSGLADAHGLMSDDVPSSPTPSSTKDLAGVCTEVHDGPDMEDALQDLPSSPPRADPNPRVHPTPIDEVEQILQLDQATVDTTDFAVQSEIDVTKGSEHRHDRDQASSPFPSDSLLPTEQLQLEEEAASGVSANVSKLNNIPQADPSDTLGAAQQTSGPDQDPTQSSEATETDPSINESARAKDNEQEITRVEDSFLEPDPVATTEVNSQSTNGSQRSPRTSRKRKRSNKIGYVAKKRQQQVPLNAVESYVTAREQDDDGDEEEDIGEEIIVASSQRSSPPITYNSQGTTSLLSQASDVESSAGKEPVHTVNEENGSNTMAPPPKRGRGRPRKSQTPTSSQSKVVSKTTLKRKASTLSDESTADAPEGSTLVKAAPAVKKSRKKDERNKTTLGSASQTSQRDQVTTPTKPRKMAAVVVVERSRRSSPASQSSEQADELAEEQIDITTPEKQLQAEHAAATPQRPMLTPRSILRRLRNALTDFKGMIMGSQEEREFDDVLFEFRRETHEAGRRGRE